MLVKKAMMQLVANPPISAQDISTRLPELVQLERIYERIAKSAANPKWQVLSKINVKHHELPIYGLTLGSQDPNAPALGLFAGVHGLERIGTSILISFFETLAELLLWDESLAEQLKRFRLVAIPLINPGGMYMRRRSNPNGVDLMRNAPIDAEGKPRYRLIAGHRISPIIPWYRGKKGAPMEEESNILCDFVRKNLLNSPTSIALDIHSGFGVRDRLWFPWAKSLAPFPHLAEMMALKALLDRSYPNHIYQIEPQALQYTTHGDLWDYLYIEQLQQSPEKLFLPLALELGSWIWVKKNPRQIFTALGAFNPLIPHRQQRILRRHLVLLEFLQKATLHHQHWRQLNTIQKETYKAKAMSLWYKEATNESALPPK